MIQMFAIYWCIGCVIAGFMEGGRASKACEAGKDHYRYRAKRAFWLIATWPAFLLAVVISIPALLKWEPKAPDETKAAKKAEPVVNL